MSKTTSTSGSGSSTNFCQRLLLLFLCLFALASVKVLAQQAPETTLEGDTLARLEKVAGSLSEDPGWEVTTIRDPFSQETIEAYRSLDVQADVLMTKVALAEAVGDNRFLAAYLDISIPSDVGLTDGAGVVPRQQAEALWNQTSLVARALGSLPSLTVDLKVITLPEEGAAVRLEALGVKEVRETMTTGTLSRVWRGLYRYEVRMNGGLVWQGQLDLVQEVGTQLVCVLPTNLGDAPVPCRLEEI